MIVFSWSRLDDRTHFYRTQCEHIDKFCHAGDARAILTPPMHVTTVKVYKSVNVVDKLAAGDVYICRTERVLTGYTICLRDSLQALALMALVENDPQELKAELLRSVEFFNQVS